MAGREVISVFLASPGDVANEREVARTVVDQVNRKIAKHLGLHVELYGWEDQSPGYGRPQGQINPHVDEAELFVGLLWRQWGTPSGDEYTSGFEEEYSRACAIRKERGDRPEVCLFFKDVEEAQRADAGEELQKVLDFRLDVEERREVLYDTFRDADDWREKLYLLITEYVAKSQQGRGPQEPDRAPDPASATADAAEHDVNRGSASEAAAQLVEALEGARDLVARSDGDERPELLKALRILLASFPWVSDLQTAETFGTHELNLLYRHRDELKILGRERFHLVRSMLMGEAARPGWYWLAQLEPPRPEIFLAYLARSDSNPDVRRRALETLRDVRLLAHLPDVLSHLMLEPDNFLRTVLDDGDAGVRVAALRLAGRYASDDAVELLSGLREDPNLGEVATAALARALLQREPAEALKLLGDDSFLVAELREDLVEAASRFSNEAVAPLRAHELSLVRDIALRIDIASGRLTEDVARQVLQDEDTTVKARAVDAMMERGWAVDEDVVEEILKERIFPTGDNHRLRLQRELAKNEGDLRADANWYLPYGEYAYEALGLNHASAFGDQIRRDVGDNFDAFRAESLQRLRERFGEQGVDALGRENEYREPSYLRAAMSVLGNKGVSADAELVRSYLSHKDAKVQLAALRALRHLDASSASEEAQRFATNDALTAEQRQEVARMAIEISPAAALALTANEDSKVAALAASSLLESEASVERLKELLQAEHVGVREAAVRRLGAMLSPEQLEVLLAEYTQSHYYYNVVVWLDRFLYCPEPFRGWYLEHAQEAA